MRVYFKYLFIILSAAEAKLDGSLVPRDSFKIYEKKIDFFEIFIQLRVKDAQRNKGAFARLFKDTQGQN
jgi:hypothetical protein